MIGSFQSAASAEEADRHIAIVAVLRRERGTSSERNMRADDSVTTEHAVLFVEHVHRATEPLRAAGLLAEQLGHHRTRGHALRDRDAVIAIGGDDVVALAQRGHCANTYGLLPNIEVEEASNLALGVCACRFFFKSADQLNLSIESLR
jgi:hypothetical protein